MNLPLYFQSQGNGKPLLLIHGWTMQSLVWSLFLEEFSKKYRVIAVDLRGHGKSSLLTGSYDFKTLAADISSLIECLALKEVTLIGWSMGVSVILKMFEHAVPDVDSLVFISGTPSLTERSDYPHGLPRGAVRRLARNLTKDYVSAMKDFYTLLFTEQESALLQENRLFSLVADLEHLPQKEVARESLESFLNEDLRPSLQHIRVPALLIHGGLDRISLPDASRYMAGQLSNAQLMVLAATGHVPFLTQKAAVHSAIGKFLNTF